MIDVRGSEKGKVRCTVCTSVFLSFLSFLDLVSFFTLTERAIFPSVVNTEDMRHKAGTQTEGTVVRH